MGDPDNDSISTPAVSPETRLEILRIETLGQHCTPDLATLSWPAVRDRAFVVDSGLAAKVHTTHTTNSFQHTLFVLEPDGMLQQLA